MAIKLYRKGTTHNINGIDCEIRLFDVRYGNSFAGVDGWCLKPEDIGGESVVEEVENTEPLLDDLDPSDIREQAKAAGIEGWENKRINTLKEALSGQDS